MCRSKGLLKDCNILDMPDWEYWIDVSGLESLYDLSELIKFHDGMKIPALIYREENRATWILDTSRLNKKQQELMSVMAVTSKINGKGFDGNWYINADVLENCEVFG